MKFDHVIGFLVAVLAAALAVLFSLQVQADWTTIDIKPDGHGGYSYERWDLGRDFTYGTVRSSINGYTREEFGTGGYRYEDIEINRRENGIEINTWDY